LGNPKLELKEHVAEEKESIEAVVAADVRKDCKGYRVDSFALIGNTDAVTRGVTEVDRDETTRSGAKVVNRRN